MSILHLRILLTYSALVRHLFLLQQRKTKMVDIIGTKLAYNEAFEFNVNANYDGELRVQLFKKNTGILGEVYGVATLAWERLVVTCDLSPEYMAFDSFSRCSTLGLSVEDTRILS